MPFHHVTAGLLYKGNYLNRSLSAGSDSEQLANISVEELDGECCPRFPWLWGWGRLLCTFSGYSMRLPGGFPLGRQVGSGMAQQIGDTETVPGQSCAGSCGVI